ncbi:MAG: adenylosuccinate synthase [Chloroflexi bacterium]|nr:adenylosuccinate synthase [Chloroflexota bacterium]
MPAIAVIGGQWGDEGKGKIVEMVAAEAQWVARYSGGNNAGHTVLNPQGLFKLHLIPVGIFHPQVSCVIGNGTVVDPAALLEEIEELESHGVSTERLYLSDRAHLVMPYHILLDGLEEAARGGGAIGTTGRGIGPAYMDKVARTGLRVGDLLDQASFARRLGPILEAKNILLTRVYGRPPLSFTEVYETCCRYGERLAPRIRETDRLLQGALERGELVLLEGAQGAMLDIDFGTYPYVTSSSPSVGGVLTGSGIGPGQLKHIVGVFKAYTTRVGGGPMPTELLDETCDLIRERAQEYGTTTGRPRRCGWFDAVAARYAARINGFTSLALTRLDVLDVLPSVKVCVEYRAAGKPLTHFPASLATLEGCQPVYEELPGWETSTQGARRFQELPREAQAYVRRLETLLGCPASLVSVGAGREETIRLRPLLGP